MFFSVNLNYFYLDIFKSGITDTRSHYYKTHNNTFCTVFSLVNHSKIYFHSD